MRKKQQRLTEQQIREMFLTPGTDYTEFFLREIAAQLAQLNECIGKTEEK